MEPAECVAGQLTMNTANPKPRWGQFGLKQMLLCVLLVAAGVSLWAMNRERENALSRLEQAKDELAQLENANQALAQLALKERAILRLKELRATIRWHFQVGPNGGLVTQDTIPGEPWLKQVLGEHYAVKPTHVELSDYANMNSRAFTDSDAELISHLDSIDWLVLRETQLTDEGLMHLGKISELGRIDVSSPHLTDKGAQAFRDAYPNVRFVLEEYIE